MASRSHLVPETRVDKTGRVTKRWVKPQAPVSVARQRGIPSPLMNKSATPVGYTDKQKTQQRDFSFNTHRLRANPKLHDLVVKRFPLSHYGNRLPCRATDEEAYELLTRYSVPDAAMLLLLEVKTPQQAQELIKSNKIKLAYESFPDDPERQGIINEALKRKITAPAYIEMALERNTARERCTLEMFLDAAEVASIPTLQGIGLEKDVLVGYTRLSDIKKIGGTLIKGHLPYSRDALYDLKSGSLGVTTDQFKKFAKRSRTGDELAILCDFAANYQPEVIAEFSDPMRAYYTSKRIEEKVSTEALMTAISYQDEVVKVFEESYGNREVPNIPEDDLLEMVKHKIDVADAAKGIELGLTPLQMLGVAKGAQVSLSDGWL